jgi:hypothetical protein
MTHCLQAAKAWIDDAPDLCAEQVEAAIESLGHRLKEARNLTVDQREDMRNALIYLNKELSALVSDPESGGSMVQENALSELDQSECVGDSLLDSSRLVDTDAISPAIVSDSDKRIAIEGLVSSGVVARGVSCIVFKL